MATATKRPEAYPPSQARYAALHESQMLEGGLHDGVDKEASMAYDFLRAGFVRKVFGILSAQLLLTALIAAPIVLHGPTRAFVAASPGVVLLSALGAFAIVMVLSFSEEARHRHPTNLILLAAFTALEGVAVGATAAAYTLPSVALAVAVTAGATGALAAYAQRAKTDYTARGGALVSALSALLLTSVFALFVRSRAVEVVLAGFGAALFSAYLVWDVQLLLGGQHARFQLSPDDYVAGAIALYLDIVNLFLHILRLLGSERDG